MTTPSRPVPWFDAVLVANRGEIARRIIRTLRRLGIRSIAVYSDADAQAPHVREADDAVRLGPAPARASYLDIDAVIAAARRSGAAAIHPGYGFLSENAAFARACEDAGIVFVGPGARALAVMGDKVRARAHVTASGVPIVPGFLAAGDDTEIAADADALGYPVLVKPSAGGGGKGMITVRTAADLPAALASARRLAAASFGDDTLLIERLVDAPRHLEVQVLGDATGAVVHLGERECTLQRRHQKVIEEAPSPIVDAALRARLGAAACAAAASVDYVGAGTVEFLVAGSRPDDFFFIEMNTRLQVEHPVTELVTGIDLVEEQLRIAAGHPLGFTQDDVALRGWAMEARVYAESPERRFLPSVGDVLAWRAPAGVRVDSGIETGTVVPGDYDPMIAKIIAHGPDRATAIARLEHALADTVVLGVDTNLAFVRDLLAEPRVRSGDLDTGIIDALPPRAPDRATPGMLAAAVAASSRDDRDAGPWRHDGWRAGSRRAQKVWRFGVADEVVSVDDGQTPSPAATVAQAADGAVWVHDAGRTVRAVPVTRREATLAALPVLAATGAVAPVLRAPLPGTVVAVHVADGDAVSAGEAIVTIEAMKMEHSLLAPHDGYAHVQVAVGASVSRDEVVARVTVDPRAVQE